MTPFTACRRHSSHSTVRLLSQGQWNLKAFRVPSSATATATGSSEICWAMVCLLPQSEVDIEGPSGITPFLVDLVSSLNTMGIKCSVPPVLFEQSEQSVLEHLQAGCEVAMRHYNKDKEDKDRKE